MVALKDLPGTSQHQKMLQAIISYYESDARILAVLVFGSLGRGNWDRYSDLDMDVVLADGIQMDIEAELTRLCATFASINEHLALLIPYDDEADVVFQSLMEMSIRYHPLSSTSPAIVESMRLLMGRIDRAAIEAAGLANRERRCMQRSETEPHSRELDRCLRYALEADSAIKRGYRWSAIELLHYVRKSVMELFTRSHHGQRPYQFFEKEAGQLLQVRLGGTLPQFDLGSARACLARFLEILSDDLDQLTGGQVQLTPTQAELLSRIRSRQSENN
jgi:predicted nucleotidyltransferase